VHLADRAALTGVDRYTFVGSTTRAAVDLRPGQYVAIFDVLTLERWTIRHVRHVLPEVAVEYIRVDPAEPRGPSRIMTCGAGGKVDMEIRLNGWVDDPGRKFLIHSAALESTEA
jgi:hypothetical protein